MADRFCCVTIVTMHLTYGKLFWFFIVFTRWTFWDHCQENWIIFTCLTPVEPKIWPLTFPSITTNRYVVDRSNYIFLNRFKRNLLIWFSTTLKQLLNLTPVQTILWPPGFLYRMWPGSNMKWWSLDPYQHNEIIFSFFLSFFLFSVSLSVFFLYSFSHLQFPFSKG